MPGLVGNRVHLNGLGDDELSFTLVNEVNRRRQELTGIDRFDHFIFAQIDRNRVLIAAIKDARDKPPYGALPERHLCPVRSRTSTFNSIFLDISFPFALKSAALCWMKAR